MTAMDIFFFKSVDSQVASGGIYATKCSDEKIKFKKTTTDM